LNFYPIPLRQLYAAQLGGKHKSKSSSIKPMLPAKTKYTLYPCFIAEAAENTGKGAAQEKFCTAPFLIIPD